MKNSNDIIGNRTRDLRVCSAVPQPTALPRAPFSCHVLLLICFMMFKIESMYIYIYIYLLTEMASGEVQWAEISVQSLIYYSRCPLFNIVDSTQKLTYLKMPYFCRPSPITRLRLVL